MRARPGCKGLSPKENREIPPLRYDWAYRLKRERPALQVIVNGGIATAKRSDGAPGSTSTARCSAARRTTIPTCCIGSTVAWFGGTLRTRGELLRALRPYVEAQLARGVALKHITGTCSACSTASAAAAPSARC